MCDHLVLFINEIAGYVTVLHNTILPFAYELHPTPKLSYPGAFRASKTRMDK